MFKVATVFIFVLIFSQRIYAEEIPKEIRSEEISRRGFTILDTHMLHEETQNFGTVDIVPALNETDGRIVLFLLNEGGRVVYEIENIESNSFNDSGARQPNTGLASIAFRDLNGDGLEDIIVICNCANEFTDFKIADVFFQKEDGFYKDWRLTDKLNRFSMNRMIDIITAYVRDGRSAEFLYTSSTLDELTGGGFLVLRAQTAVCDFEEFGEVTVVPGVYNITMEYYVFMIYLVNGDGRILWNFQFEDGSSNFDSLESLSFEDADGDGNKDVTARVRFRTMSPDIDFNLRDELFIFYQRAGYFIKEDTKEDTLE